MKRILSVVLLITIFLSFTSCASGAKALDKKFKEFGFVENTKDAREVAASAWSSFANTDVDYANEVLNSLINQGNAPRLWENGEEKIVIIECKDYDTISRLYFGLPYNSLQGNVFEHLYQSGKAYASCFIISAPDYIFDEIAKMNGYN